jgi:hypothetical protein
MKQKLKSGDEVDALYGRDIYKWRPGALRKIKRALNRRARRDWKRFWSEEIEENGTT